MPTKRTRRARVGRLSAEASAWAHSDDAGRFFTDPAAYLRPGESSYATAVQRLPEVRPWWQPLTGYWTAHKAGAPLPAQHSSQAAMAEAALAFVLELHAEYLAAREA